MRCIHEPPQMDKAELSAHDDWLAPGSRDKLVKRDRPLALCPQAQINAEEARKAGARSTEEADLSSDVSWDHEVVEIFFGNLASDAPQGPECGGTRC